jgi:hypothetical protein
LTQAAITAVSKNRTAKSNRKRFMIDIIATSEENLQSDTRKLGIELPEYSYQLGHAFCENFRTRSVRLGETAHVDQPQVVLSPLMGLIKVSRTII